MQRSQAGLISSHLMRRALKRNSQRCVIRMFVELRLSSDGRLEYEVEHIVRSGEEASAHPTTTEAAVRSTTKRIREDLAQQEREFNSLASYTSTSNFGLAGSYPLSVGRKGI